MRVFIPEPLLNSLTYQAKVSPRLRMNMDLRNSPSDGSQRMLNAIEHESPLPIHRHRSTSETVVVLRGWGGRSHRPGRHFGAVEFGAGAFIIDIDMTIDKPLLDSLTSQAKASPRLRMNLDLRNSPEDGSQWMYGWMAQTVPNDEFDNSDKGWLSIGSNWKD